MPVGRPPRPPSNRVREEYQHTDEYRQYVNESNGETILNNQYHHVRHYTHVLDEKITILCKENFNSDGWVYEYNITKGRANLNLGNIRYCPVCGRDITLHDDDEDIIETYRTKRKPKITLREPAPKSDPHKRWQNIDL